MSGAPAYGRERERERGGGGDREANYRSGGGGVYNNRGGGFRGRGGGPGGYKPRRYWDNDDYYKDERDHGRRRRRRSYSRSRSRSRSYSSRSRSRSPPPRRSRSRSPPKPDEVSERPPEQARPVPEMHEPYVPSKDSGNTWSNSRMQIPQEYMTHSNGQVPVALNPVNPYGNVDTAYPPHYHEGPPPGVSTQRAMGFGYSHNTIPVNQVQYPPQQATDSMYPHLGGINQTGSVAPPPPALSETKSTKEESSEGSNSKKKKDKRKRKKRHHSSSSSSSSSDDSSESRRRRKSKKEQGSSDSSSEDEKKDSSSSSGLTTQQKDALLKQREGYQTKLEILEREIAKLQAKEDELVRNRVDRQLINENLNLQAELTGRCKAVVIVLEKIDEVLKVGNKPSSTAVEKPKPVVPPPQVVVAPPPKAPKMPVSESHSSEVGKKDPFEYFDNRQHWCRLCNVFPETVEQMLEHFHSKEHHDQIQQLGIDEKPWHKRNAVTEAKPVSGARKAPFRGMQFFSPVEGWYCRLCNSWMGDPHCAVEHLKSEDHNSNYMNFLEEHPDWEKKWVNDREKAIGTSGKQDSTLPNKKSRFDDRNSKDKTERKVEEDVDTGKSIRVQMRNASKGEGRDSISQFTAAPINEMQSSKDSGLEEWMSKPKVAVDLIDTQKFAAIVRQKHGAKEKEAAGKEGKTDVVDVKTAPSAAAVSSQKDKDYKKEKDDKRRPDKVELQISSRDKDRDRYRERDSRSSRRRSRSKSRSRSRERRYNRRRSRSRSRDRPDRDRRDRGDRDRPDFKETVKKLPMIGKMPLYKRPIISREKPEIERSKVDTAVVASPAVTLPVVGFISKEVVSKSLDVKTELYTDNSVNSAYAYSAHSSYDHEASNPEGYMMSTSEYGHDLNAPSLREEASKDFQQSPETDDIPSGDLKEDKEDAPAALPDDFQQALDIIYAVNTGSSSHQGKAVPGMLPQPVPPPVSAVPSTNGISEEAPPGVSEYDYSSNGYASYMGYQPYQQSFDGYAPVGYDELDDGPPGVGDENTTKATPVGVPPPVSETGQTNKVVNDPPPPGDDDMDDLRMLGIDVEDTAVVHKH